MRNFIVIFTRICVEAGVSQVATPILVTAGGVVIGIQQNIPLFYLYVGAFALFAAVSSGLLRFNEWKNRNRIADKLVFHGVRVNPKLDEVGIRWESV